MRASKYIPKLAFDNVMKKKNRTMLSFISVMLSSAIIFVSFTLFTTVFTLSKTLDRPDLGTAHYYVETETFENLKPLQFFVSYYSNPNEKNISYFDQRDEATFFQLKEGALPSRVMEVIVPENTLNIGEYVEQYEVVGIYSPSLLWQKTMTEFPYLSIDDSLVTEKNHYFIFDTHVHESQSVISVSDICQVSASQVIQNEDRITNDTILNYLQDTTTILGMFILIICIAIFMCLVSIYNVLIVNDQDRRKEIGLLKSIGITKKELIYMLVLEMTMIGFVAALVGIALGMGISYFVLTTVLEQLKVTFNMGMLLNAWIIILSLVAGVLLMVISGLVLYRKYFDSKPISDLKGEAVQYDIAYNADRFSITSVTWRMFVIYNERIKKQTNNLQRSFMLVMLTITLFCGIFVSNFLYQRRYNSEPSDFIIEAATLNLGSKRLYPELDELIYNITETTDVEFSNRKINRNIIGQRFQMPSSTFTDAYKKTNDEAKELTIDGITYLTAHHEGLVLDKNQLNELRPYVTQGSLDQLTEKSTILIIYQHGQYSSTTKLREVNIGDPVICRNMDNSKPFPDQYYTCDAVVELPTRDFELEYSNATDFLFNLAFTEESFATLDGPATTLRYDIEMALENPSLHYDCVNYLTEALNQTDNQEILLMTDYMQIRNDGHFAVFLIEVLLYPLLLMLVMIGVINVNNVLKGNIHMKRTDFSTMKSVGMTSNQLSMIMTYEYAETYFNAGFMVFLLTIPLIVFEKFVSIASTFKIADNFAGMFVMSFVIISPVIIISLAVLSFRHLRNITALDGMKDIE